ncbi:hypothetical protein M404DRAFT_998691 [Pisolithus tinctorius Marx 270]|uniref:Uncharacterized protein n=1 Tax=Pisolithus tinctorius Marx 270 TaxID=870435 RepID=A0A0C3JBV2_PISTI|nr:hypothetical protein M404DRAFT_998691 [Pisolithus tinctorius Marx 270]
MSSIPFTDLAASRYSKIRISSMTNLMHNLYDGSPMMSRHYQNGRKGCTEFGRQVAMKFLCGCNVVEACSDANQSDESRTSENPLLP